MHVLSIYNPKSEYLYYIYYFYTGLGVGLDVQVVVGDGGVNATLGLCTAILVHEILEATRALSSIGKPDLAFHLLG
jgi:hypothetical protein